MQEIKITKSIVNERKELVVSFLVKEWDYTEVEAELLRQAKLEWNLLDISFEWLTKWDTQEERKKELQRLGWLMARYCELSWTSEIQETDRLYKKYGIQSRTQLTDEQLSTEIETYKAWVMQYS